VVGTWRRFVSRLFDDAVFGPPSTPQEIDAAERQLKVNLPEELRSLYLETNGVRAHYGTSMVWSVAGLVAQNSSFRTSPEFATLYMPFDNLLFFGEELNGDQFAYRILAGKIDSLDIFEWDHETDSRVWFARDLRDYFQRSVPQE
jgi:hypothetical protein